MKKDTVAGKQPIHQKIIRITKTAQIDSGLRKTLHWLEKFWIRLICRENSKSID
jgi:hypothetical protein